MGRTSDRCLEKKILLEHEIQILHMVQRNACECPFLVSEDWGGGEGGMINFIIILEFAGFSPVLSCSWGIAPFSLKCFAIFLKTV